MKFEVTINTVNSASWMMRIGTVDFNIRTDKAVFTLICDEGQTREESLLQLSKAIHDFCMTTPDLTYANMEITKAVCRSFEEAANEMLKIDTSKPVDFYRSWTYEKYRTAVIAVKEIV